MATQDTRIDTIWNNVSDERFKRNILHGYESVTYDITLAMATPRDTRKWLALEVDPTNDIDINSLDSSVFQDETIILAQTASTVTQITSLSMQSTTAPNQKNSITYTSNFSMQAVQPLGSSLLRNIYKAAAILNIENHYSHPYFLQVYLKGRKGDGSLPESEIPGTRRCYCIHITDIKYTIDVGATTYNIQAIRAGQMAQADDHNLVAKLDMTSIGNFEDFTRKFVQALGEQERHFLGQSKLILDQYEVQVTADTDKEKQDFLDSAIIDDVNKQNFSNQDPVTGEVKAEIEKNTRVTEILEKFISRNTYIQREAQGTRKSIAERLAEDDIKDIKLDKMLATISTHAIPLAYDPLRRDYARKFVYTINLVKSVTVAAAVVDEHQPNKGYTVMRVKKLLETGRLVKRYDYFNTGTNLDVLNFDINYNFQYVFGLDTLVGLYNKYSDQFGTLLNREASSQRQIDEVAANATRNQDTWNNAIEDNQIDFGENYAILSARRDILNSTRERFLNGTVEPDANTLQAYNELVEDYNSSIADLNTSLAEISNPNSEVVALTTAQTLNPNDFIEPPTNVNRPGYNKLGKQQRLITYAETIDDQKYISAAEKNGTMLPTQFYERYLLPLNEGMIEIGAQSDFNTILQNAKAGSNEMVRAQLDIIGDPYWIDLPQMSADKYSEEVANYRNENVVMLVSIAPREPDAQTGLLPPASSRADEFLTALYRVIQVQSRFENGQFIQKLDMVRDTITDLSLMVDGDLNQVDNAPPLVEPQVGSFGSGATGVANPQVGSFGATVIRSKKGLTIDDLSEGQKRQLYRTGSTTVDGVRYSRAELTANESNISRSNNETNSSVRTRSDLYNNKDPVKTVNTVSTDDSTITTTTTFTDTTATITSEDQDYLTYGSQYLANAATASQEVSDFKDTHGEPTHVVGYDAGVAFVTGDGNIYGYANADVQSQYEELQSKETNAEIKAQDVESNEKYQYARAKEIAKNQGIPVSGELDFTTQGNTITHIEGVPVDESNYTDREASNLASAKELAAQMSGG